MDWIVIGILIGIGIILAPIILVAALHLAVWGLALLALFALIVGMIWIFNNTFVAGTEARDWAILLLLALPFVAFSLILYVGRGQNLRTEARMPNRRERDGIFTTESVVRSDLLRLLKECKADSSWLIKVTNATGKDALYAIDAEFREHLRGRLKLM